MDLINLFIICGSLFICVDSLFSCPNLIGRPLDNVGKYPSLAIGNDGFAIISYFDDEILKVRHCKDSTCLRIDSAFMHFFGGTSSAIAIGVDCKPIIAHAPGIQVIHCKDTICSGRDSLVNLTGGNNNFVGMVIGVDGFPIISFYDATAGELLTVHCLSINCSLSEDPICVDCTGDNGEGASIAIGVDNFPVISYGDQFNNKLKVLHCTTINCSSHDPPSSLDSKRSGQSFSSIAIGIDGLPVISCVHSSKSLKVVHCRDINCTSADNATVLDGNPSRYTSIGMGYLSSLI